MRRGMIAKKNCPSSLRKARQHPAGIGLAVEHSRCI
jgi:hypothetical protein